MLLLGRRISASDKLNDPVLGGVVGWILVLSPMEGHIS